MTQDLSIFKSLFEYLISPNELCSSDYIYLNSKKLISIDKSKKNLKIFKKNITSKNSPKLSKKEILFLIKEKPEYI